MNNKTLLYVIGLFVFLGTVFAVGFHPANEILAGTFTGNYTFVGDVNVSNNLYVGGNLSDLAENIWSVGDIGAGDLVVLAGGEVVELTSTAYDSRVAGVISTAPATIFGINKGDVPLAISGRVPVKVTNEGGVIEVGDLLTSSSTPGHAMKCSNLDLCYGAVVGKSMENFVGGSGEVLMLVMLG